MVFIWKQIGCWYEATFGNSTPLNYIIDKTIWNIIWYDCQESLFDFSIEYPDTILGCTILPYRYLVIRVWFFYDQKILPSHHDDKNKTTFFSTRLFDFSFNTFVLINLVKMRLFLASCLILNHNLHWLNSFLFDELELLKLRSSNKL